MNLCKKNDKILNIGLIQLVVDKLLMIILIFFINFDIDEYYLFHYQY